MGSNPSAATFYFTHPHAVENVTSNPTLESLLKQIEQLSQVERDTLASIALSGKVSILSCPREGVEEWKNHMIARGLADGTITLYTSTIRKFLDCYPMPSSRDARNYSVMRLQKVTPTKVRNDQKAIRSFFNFLEEQGLWLNNPVKTMRLVRTEKIIRQAPEKEHVDKLLMAWQGSERRLKHRLFILLFVDTGMRILEVCTLKVSNIDFDRLEIKVWAKGVRRG